MHQPRARLRLADRSNEKYSTDKAWIDSDPCQPSASAAVSEQVTGGEQGHGKWGATRLWPSSLIGNGREVLRVLCNGPCGVIGQPGIE